ncbi:MAG: hydantoinase/carbamoylase family amidase [Acetobacteraceae bacterium]|nr:hydantoinase/carbamoylase family amidase [Acetobacteraceae bacterium]
MPQINAERLLGDLYALRKIGTYKSGVHRPALSPEDIESRHWLAKRLTEAGLTAEIDGIANVFGRDPAPGRKLLIGSHLETQPHSGWLDGAMGVIYGLEAARVLGGGIDVAAWFDEEGWFGSFPGSRSFCGGLPEVEIDSSRRRGDGVPLRDALDQAGLSGRTRVRAEAGRHLGYLEAHIEQGAELELSGDRIGIVTAIVGSHRFRIEFEGAQNHAGTTRMTRRKDAGVALVQLAAAIDDRFPAIAHERTVWTTGSIALDPGSPSIVPGKAEMVFQFRDTEPAMLAALDRELEALVASANSGPCRVSLVRTGTTSPAAMDPGFQDALEASAARHAPGKFQRMPSGAGHDAQILSTIMPSAMMFVPSIGGISHHFTEDTSDADLVLGCQVFVDAAAALLGT